VSVWAEGLQCLVEAAAEERRHAVRFAAHYPERSSRVRALFRIVLAIPAYVVTALFLSLAQLLAFAAWLIIVFSGTYDYTLWRFSVGCLRRLAIFGCYLSLLRDEYPPFGEGRYPLTFDVAYARRRSRLSAFFRLLLVIPQLVVLYVLQLPLMAAVAIAWFAILIRGRYPRGLWLLVEGLNRWYVRVYAYLMLLTDEFPPYSLDLPGSATAPDETAVAPAFELELPVAEPAEAEPDFALPVAPPPVVEDAHSPGFFAFPPRPAAGEADAPDQVDPG
jgi:hypothetical protein